jgi:hypothetical protein
MLFDSISNNSSNTSSFNKTFHDLFKPTFYVIVFSHVKQRFPLSSHGDTAIFLLKHPP